MPSKKRLLAIDVLVDDDTGELEVELDVQELENYIDDHGPEHLIKNFVKLGAALMEVEGLKDKVKDLWGK